MWAVLFALACLSVNQCFGLTSKEIANDLRPILSPESGIFFPSDAAWLTETAQRWNQWSSPSFILSVKPKREEDVLKLVQYCSRKNVSFVTTGGGHGYSGTFRRCNGIQIDMGNFNSVAVDPVKNTLTIGGSVRFRDLAGPVYAGGKAIAVGACSCVGMTGATLGGGVGFYSGLYGAISDSLASVKMVTGAGKLITASESQNSDLFWGIRGAGFNFGTVTSLTYKLVDYPNDGHLTNIDMMFPINQNESVWKTAKKFFGDQPKELSLAYGLLFDPDSEQVIIAVNAIYARSIDEGKKLLQPFFSLNPMNTSISYLPWKDVPDTALYGAIARNCMIKPYYIPYTANLYNIDVDKMIQVANYVSDNIPKQPSLHGTLVTFTQYASWGFQHRTNNYSAFPHRKPVVFAQVDGIAASESDVPSIDSFGKSLRSLLNNESAYDNSPVYIHFSHGDEGPASWYTVDNLPRLRELKKRYDPHSLFSFYNPIS